MRKRKQTKKHRISVPGVSEPLTLIKAQKEDVEKLFEDDLGGELLARMVLQSGGVVLYLEHVNNNKGAK
jgi:hypothetical protein